VATRYYATYRSPDFVWPAPLHGDWDQTYSGIRVNKPREWGWLLQTVKTNGGQIQSKSLSLHTSLSPTVDVQVLRFVTPRLAGQTVSGTLDLVLAMSVDAGGTGTVKTHAFVTVGDSNDVRGTLISNNISATSPTSTATCRAVTGIALTSQAVTAGDRIVIEIGFDVTADTGNLWRLYAGTTNSSNVAQADAVNGDTAVTARAGWFEFSGTVTEDSPAAAPANDACADATVITGSSPTYTDTVDSSTSTDTSKSVWYEWTANETNTVWFSTIGSTYNPLVRAWTGSCGSLSLAATSTPAQWIGVGQTVMRLDATSGTTYKIQISNSTSTGFCAIDSGGITTLNFSRYAVLQDGDILVSAQHLLIIRDGAIINYSSDPFNSTPTGLVIDHSARPVLNQNDDTIDTTDPRLFMTTYESELITLFDLSQPLTPITSQINYIDLVFDMADAGEAVPSGSKPSSLLADPDGNLMIGFFGDGYDGTFNGIGSQDSVNIRTVDPTKYSYDQFNENDILAEYIVDQDEGGAPYFDLNAAATIIYYTSAGREVKRFDIDGNVMMSDLVSLSAESGSRPGLRGIRVIPSGSFQGQILVADGINVKRLSSSSGSVLMTYTPSTAPEDLDKVFLADSSGTDFWVSDQLTATLFRFNLASGTEEEIVALDLPTGQLCGFTVSGVSSAVQITEPEVHDPSEECCPCDCPTPVGPKGSPTTAPLPSHTGQILPPVDVTDWTPQCAGGGDVPSAADATDPESWVM